MANENGSITQSLLGSSPIPEPDIEPLEKIFYEPGHSSSLDVAQKKIADINSRQSSFMPTMLAVASALTGNFGPAIQMQEQKRKTADIQKMLPAINEISRMKALGQYSDAAQAMEMLSTKMGSRVPEMKEMFLQQQKDLSDRQIKLNAARDRYNVMKPHITKESPDKPVWDSIGAALKSGTPGAAQALDDVLAARPHIQALNQQTTQTSQLTGAQTFAPIPEVYQQKNLDNYVGLNVGQAHGLRPEELTNVMNNIDTPGITGEKRSQIRKDLISLQDVTADIGIAGLANLPPELQAQMFANGVHPLQIATRRISKSDMSDAIKGYYEKLTQSEIAKVKGSLEVDPRVPRQAGMVFMDKTPGPNFGMPMMGLSMEQGKAMGALPLRDEDQPLVVELSRAKGNLNLINEMYEAIGSENEGLEGLSARLGQLINSKTGLPTTTAAGRAFQVLIDEAINTATNMKAIPSTEVERLRKLTTGEFAKKPDAIKAANTLSKAIDDRLNRIVGTENVQPTNQQPKLPFGLQKTRDKYLQSPQYQEFLRQQEEGLITPGGLKKGTGK